MFLVLLFGMLLYLACKAYLGYLAVRRMKSTVITEDERIQRYQLSFLWNTVSGAAVLLIVGAVPIAWEQIGLDLACSHAGDYLVVLIEIFSVCGLLAVIFLGQMIVFMEGRSYKRCDTENIDDKAREERSYDIMIRQLLPQNGWEKEWFLIMALASGSCEELVFRGFFLCILKGNWPNVSEYLLAALAGCGLGMVHFYQGARGMMRMSLFEIAMGFLYLGTKSLCFCMAFHILLEVFWFFWYDAESVESDE